MFAASPYGVAAICSHKCFVYVIQHGVDDVALMKTRNTLKQYLNLISFQGMKCSFDLCRICCRIKAIDEALGCQGNY